MAVAQHSVPPSVEPAQSEGTVQAMTFSAAHVPWHAGAACEMFAQHVSPLVQGVPGQAAPASEIVPLLLPLEPAPLLLPPEELPLLELVAPLLLPDELAPLELPVAPLELPLLPDDAPPLDEPPPSGDAVPVAALDPHAVQTRAPPTKAADPTKREARARNAPNAMKKPPYKRAKKSAP
jgi:hypothetical protein